MFIKVPKFQENSPALNVISSHLLSLIFLWITMIPFYILSKRFYLKLKGLPNDTVVSLIKKENGFAVHFQ